ncbi:hypothetical protein V1460_11980 [Streptomyces sp. SCSIO 30461]|uniref:hypothetical protein n=1 Tax=Streptomyces sp. SCSIO 30461 TaxID=3118085 RepID=UPI0030D21145
MSATTAMSSRERAAAQAYLRLLSAVRAALTDAPALTDPPVPPGPCLSPGLPAIPGPPLPPGTPVTAGSTTRPGSPALFAPMAEADLALATAGFAGNEAALFDLVTGLHGAGIRCRAAEE